MRHMEDTAKELLEFMHSSNVLTNMDLSLMQRTIRQVNSLFEEPSVELFRRIKTSAHMTCMLFYLLTPRSCNTAPGEHAAKLKLNHSLVLNDLRDDCRSVETGASASPYAFSY